MPSPPLPPLREAGDLLQPADLQQHALHLRQRVLGLLPRDLGLLPRVLALGAPELRVVLVRRAAAVGAAAVA